MKRCRPRLLNSIPAFLLVTLLILPFVAGEKNLQSSPTDQNQLVILHPKIEVFEVETEVGLHFHVFNSSGRVLNASADDYNCTLYLYNGSMRNIYHGGMTANNQKVQVNITINNTGIYFYNAWCNSAFGEWGYLSNHFYVTLGGKNYSPGNTGLTPLVVIAGVFALCALLLYAAFNLDKKKHFFLQIIILVFVIVLSAVLIPKTVLDYANNYNTSNRFFISALWFVRLFWAYLFFYIFYEVGKPIWDSFMKKLGRF